MLKGVNNITLPVYKELTKKINEVKESGIDISKLPQINADIGELTEEQFNSVKGKIWYSIPNQGILYPINNESFFFIDVDSYVYFVTCIGTGENFEVIIDNHILLSEEDYNKLMELTQPISATGTCEINNTDEYIVHITINKEQRLPKLFKVVSKDNVSAGYATISLAVETDSTISCTIDETSGIFANTIGLSVDYMGSNNGVTSIDIVIQLSTQASQIDVPLDVYLYEVVESDYAV